MTFDDLFGEVFVGDVGEFWHPSSDEDAVRVPATTVCSVTPARLFERPGAKRFPSFKDWFQITKPLPEPTRASADS